jgi:hypothetical protein
MRSTCIPTHTCSKSAAARAVLPSIENERLIAEAGFDLLQTQDLTAAAALVAARWHDPRAQHREALVTREGEGNFDGLQRFLSCVRRLSDERRLSRICYVALKSCDERARV